MMGNTPSSTTSWALANSPSNKTLPLALPVLLGGARTAAVSSVGLAAVTALIGAGGLGSVLFEGLFANAQDVVLLGVLPIIALGVVVDALFKALMGLAWWRVHPW